MDRLTRPSALVLLVALVATQVAATRDVENGSFRPPSDYKLIKAEIPEECQLPHHIDLNHPSNCKKRSRGFSACGVFDTRRTTCASFCDRTILSRALQVRTCRNRPSFWTLYVMHRYCRWQCYRANRKMRRALYGRNKVDVKALVYVSFKKRRYSAKHIVFRTTLRVLKYRRPARCKPNPPCRKPGDKKGCKKTFCGKVTISRNESSENCWFCKWIGTRCPSSCGEHNAFSWAFQWSY